MLDVSAVQPDVLGFLRDWLRSESAGTALERVDVVAYDDDGRHAPPFVLLEEAGAVRLDGAAFYQPYRVAWTVWARTNREAAALSRALTDIVHGADRAWGADGVGFAHAAEEVGPQPGPEGRWPARTGVVALYAPDRAITTGS